MCVYVCGALSIEVSGSSRIRWSRWAFGFSVRDHEIATGFGGFALVVLWGSFSGAYGLYSISGSRPNMGAMIRVLY